MDPARQPLPTEPWRRADTVRDVPRILAARSLGTAHRRLADLLRPGLTVLDVGCGPGAITSGIATAVVPGGRAVGIDINPALIEQARQTYCDVPGLTFDLCDVYSLSFREEFDIVTSARVLQWLARPLDALRMMVRAARPGGRVVVLDYNHEKTRWKPDPPPAMRRFYTAFLRWRADQGLDNAIADHLPELFARAGLADVVATPQLEVTTRTDPDFALRFGIWAEIAAFHGPRMVEDGVLTEQDRAAAEADYRDWIRGDAESQTLYLVAVEGTRRADAG